MTMEVTLSILAVCAVIQTGLQLLTWVSALARDLVQKKAIEDLKVKVFGMLDQAQTWVNLGGFVAGTVKPLLETLKDGHAGGGIEGARKNDGAGAGGEGAGAAGK